MSSEFSGKVAIITGASSGLGQATAGLMAKRGATITLCGRDEQRLDQVAKQCAKESQRSERDFLKFAGDITKAEIRQEIVNKTVEKFGQIDILVNNAGITLPQGNLLDVREEAFDTVMSVNLKSAFFLSQASVPYLEKSGGCIVNMSSILSSAVGVGYLLHSMSKAAMDHMTRTMALELAPKGIRVNAVNPAYIPGTGIDRDVPDGDELQRQFLECEIAQQPLYGACGTGEDIAKSVCFLASTEARFITGQCQVVDGGRTFMGPVKEII